MMNNTTLTIILRNDTIENWEAKGTIPPAGEIVLGLNGDVNIIKIGDGIHRFRDLPEITDVAYAFEHGHVKVRNENPIGVGKVQFKFLSDELQAEVDEGNKLTFDMTEVNTYFEVKG